MHTLPDYAPLSPETLERIRAAVGPDNLVLDPAALEEASADASTERLAPEALVYATDAAQIAALLRLAGELRFPVTPRGAGTGLAAGALAAHGGVVLSMARMDNILAVDAANLTATVQPGAIVAALRDAARAKGLFYPPDPASLDTATIGGTAATNAGGPACVKYGVTRHYVLGLTAVLPSGQIIRTGTATRKGVVGYDLTQLLVGSEGTLAVITELTVKLVPHPETTRTALAVFHSLEAAMDAVAAVMAAGVTPSAIEFLDSACLHLVGDLLPVDGLPRSGALLLLETDGSAASAQADMDRASAVCAARGAAHLLPAEDEAQRQTLWNVRRQVSLRIHDSAPVYVSEDVVLPLARIAAFVAELPALAGRHGVTIYAFGHSGDGNIHVNITAPQTIGEALETCITELLTMVLDMGGTMSGEHGIGIAKRRFLPLELSPASMALQRALKLTFDPGLVLNPGKVFA